MNVLTKDIKKNLEEIKSRVNIEKSFDLIKRDIIIGERNACIIFIDGFIKDDVMERILDAFFKLSKEQVDSMTTSKEFADSTIPYVEVDTTNSIEKIITMLLSGPTVLLIDGFEEAFILDLRTYPARTTAEPDKEKVTRGSKDGFVETVVFNTALIRRRIRDPKLTFEIYSIGKRSKADVVLGYIDGVADSKLLNEVKDKLSSLKVESLSMNQQSLIEALTNYKYYNPFPKVKYTERPDVAAAHILEGKLAIIVDNSPSVIMLPTSIFDFLQEAEEFYYPPVTGNYLRISRNFVLLLTLILTPTWILLVQNQDMLPQWLSFIGVKDMNKIPLVLQFLALELAIDGLKMASLSTPGSLGTSLGVIGGLVLGDYAVQVGWFVPETILYMAFIAVGSFAQPNIELGYAMKFCRIFLLLTTWWLNFIGYFGGLIVIILLVAFNKTLTGDAYLYPLIPFNWKDLKAVLWRSELKQGKRVK